MDLAKDYVRDLKRAGKSWVGVCPFHEEKTPSFHISPEKGVFHCFGCSAGGDAISFYMKAENLNFREAVETLCDRMGIPKPKGWGTNDGGAEMRLRVQLQKVLELASKLYAEALWLREDPLAETGRDYLLNQRRIDRKVIQSYKIGLAPKGPNWLLTRLVTKHGIEPKMLEKAGLVTVSSRDGRYLDFFRSRILFPVYDLNGKVTGFGGRILGADQQGPKYLNSVDSSFFKKGEMLYGLNEHKGNIRSAGKAYLVEGYFDVVGMAQAGVPLAVSPMGGSLTPGHARLIRRFTEKIVMLFDPDAAGINGAIRAARMLVALGTQVSVLKIPSGMDPDEYLLAYGKAAFEVLEEKEAKNFIDFELEHRIVSAPAASDLQGRMSIARAMIPSLSALTSEVERRESLVRTAQLLRLDPVGLERELYKTLESAKSDGARRGATAKPVVPKPEWELTLDEVILAIAMQDPQGVRAALAEAGIEREDFQNPKIAEYLFPEGKPGSGNYDLEWQELVGRVSVSQDLGATAEGNSRLAGYIDEMRRRKLSQEAKRLKEAIDSARQRKTECPPEVLQRYYELAKILKR